MGTKILVEEIAENTWFTGGLLKLHVGANTTGMAVMLRLIL
ncbi:hypothetical protein ABLT32_02415 [Bacteroides pyogenes]